MTNYEVESVQIDGQPAAILRKRAGANALLADGLLDISQLDLALEHKLTTDEKTGKKIVADTLSVTVNLTRKGA